MQRLVDMLNAQPKSSVKVVTIDDTKKVIYTAPIYKNSPFTLPANFSTDFTDREVFYSTEVENWLSKTFGYKQITRWEIL